MSVASPGNASTEPKLQPELQDGLVGALTSAYAMLLKRQRTASSAYVRWTATHARAHEFAWLDRGQEALLLGGGTVKIEPNSPIYSSVQKMMATMELNPYERELQYGYPYVIGQSDGIVFRAPLLTVPIAIRAESINLTITVAEDRLRFNSLPFRSEMDTGARELALGRLIEDCPELPLTTQSLTEFCGSVARELGVTIGARLNGVLNTSPAQPRQKMDLKIVDNAACFIAPKTSYFLVSDLETIGQAGVSASVATTALGWMLGKRPDEPTSDKFLDRGKLFYPFPSNPSQRRVAHLVDDPNSRITVVQGPPGTGKSLTIANLACHLVANGKRVLITSQKDKALQVVDEMLKGLGLAELPMTLLRQDRESKKQLRERLESIQKERSAEEASRTLELGRQQHQELAKAYDQDELLLMQAIIAEHTVERADIEIQEASGLVSRLKAKWKASRTWHRAERSARLRSDSIGRDFSEKRGRLRSAAFSLLKHAADHRTCKAQKAERNQLRELAKLLGPNQTNAKNFPIFDRMKAEPSRCNMLLNILPCWIMSPDDVARLFPCTPGLFDIVIIDEASQCDLPSMTPVLYRANQVVIAGDSKQMQAQRFAFTSNQVSAQAWAQQGLDRLDPDRWLDPSKIDLLQLSSVRMDEEVFLDEHYRSLPAIIEFSNRRWYGGRLRIMRDADDKRCGDPETPAITLYRTTGKVSPGTQENEVEARALVAQLRELLDHPGYSEASFGVICLFEEQMRLVNDLVADQIDEDVRVAHELVVVNPDGFQGDERDVILYSLSYDADGMSQQALSARQAEREHIQGMLNVAFTRAREEMHVFHSANIAAFGMVSGQGAIKDWLTHCADQKPIGESEPTGLEAELARAQSQFEQHVITALHAKGVRVRGQYPSCGFFIDVVAELNGDRIAIECDGEIWHHDEHGELKAEDVARQETLERAGWKVVRVPYRSWRENSEAQVQRLLDELKGIEEQTVEPNVTLPIVKASLGAPLEVGRFEFAIIKAAKDGARSKEDVFRSARITLGYSRMGSKIHASLHRALTQLVRKEIIRLEEDEVFFQNAEMRNREYKPANQRYR